MTTRSSPSSLLLLCLMEQDLLVHFQGSCPHHINTMQSLTSDEITTSKKPSTSVNLIILLRLWQVDARWSLSSASGASWDQLADQIGVTSTRQILGQCCSESMLWWWSRPRLMKSPPGQISWPWREWCKVHHISRARSRRVSRSGWRDCERKQGIKRGWKVWACKCTRHKPVI